ncbi:WD40-repeat-containing domain protein [Earliella scabrosa]|nr:WD40-repeat-containing domain protein [Earliella scabrosa]KAI0744847.1 WD40-repeat-containing domain protein [Earliella scabrosa]
MPGTRYTQTAHLTDGHSGGITAVVFNPDGSFLATAGLDGTVCIWDTKTWLLLDVYRSKAKVTSLAWFDDEALVCGLADGIISSMVKGENFTHVRGMWGHLYPVEHLAVSGGLLASGAQQELCIWHWNPNPAMACLFRSLPSPLTPQRPSKARKRHGDKGKERQDTRKEAYGPVQQNDGRKEVGDQEVLITGVFWTPSCLVIAYLSHGVRLFDRETWQCVQTLGYQDPIVTSSLSPNGALLAAYNPGVGFQIYNLDTGKITQTFKQGDEGEHSRAIQVSFIHGGHAIVGGSTSGSLTVWFVESERKLPALAVPGDGKVLALSGYYVAEKDIFMIAAGIMNEDGPSPVIVWTAGGSLGGKKAAEPQKCDEDQKSPFLCTIKSLIIRAVVWLAIVLLFVSVMYMLLKGEWVDEEYDYGFGEEM